MSKLKNMRGIEIPHFRAVSSGLKTFDELFGDNGFCEWIDVKNEHLIQKQIFDEAGFLWHEGDKNVFIRAIKDNVTEGDVAPYEIIEFPGGMFLVATGDEKDNNDLEETIGCMMDWIKTAMFLNMATFPKAECVICQMLTVLLMRRSVLLNNKSFCR